MSQQEEMSHSWKQVPHKNIRTQRYSWRSQNKGSMPKEEHPTTFEDSLSAYYYPAQDSEPHGQHLHQNEIRQEDARYRQYSSSDGAAFERHYRSERQQAQGRQGPLWAQPQRHPRKQVWRWLMAVIVVAILIKPILWIMAIIGGAIIIFLGVIFGILVMCVMLVLLLLMLIGIVFRHRILRVNTGRPWGKLWM